MSQELAPALKDTIATLKAAVVEYGEDVVLAALANGGVFLPRHLLVKQLRETEGLLEGEKFAHTNTGEELDRTKQLLEAEREARLNLQAELQSLKGSLEPAATDETAVA